MSYKALTVAHYRSPRSQLFYHLFFFVLWHVLAYTSTVGGNDLRFFAEIACISIMDIVVYPGTVTERCVVDVSRCGDTCERVPGNTRVLPQCEEDDAIL